jgi:hypothetical protein
LPAAFSVFVDWFSVLILTQIRTNSNVRENHKTTTHLGISRFKSMQDSAFHSALLPFQQLAVVTTTFRRVPFDLRFSYA